MTDTEMKALYGALTEKINEQERIRQPDCDRFNVKRGLRNAAPA